jgi:hypothetical protein
MGECERRGQKYLFRLRQTKGVKELIAALERQGRWVDAGAGWQAREGALRLMGWSRERRVVVLRRDANAPRSEPPVALPEPSPAGAATPAEPSGLLVEVAPEPAWEFIVLVTNLDWEPRSLAQSYRQRADCENAFDELKNQWGWGGFVTRDLLRSRISARTVALL